MNTFCPLVSIIIPVYNGSNYMREAIDSALSQTYGNIEVIVINDGSTDHGETDRIAHEYGDAIRYISKENGGVSTALNVGIQNMRGEYFSWLSHDDIYTPDKIEVSVRALSKIEDKKALVCCQSIHIDKNSCTIHNMQKSTSVSEPVLYTWDTMLMKMLTEGSMNGCALLIHKSIFEECGMFDETLRFNQDCFMWNKIFLKKYPMLCIPEICVKNRIHEKQLTQTGQKIFHSDCEKMSAFLIPELLCVSDKNKNFIVAYIKYNAKYNNKNVVRSSYRSAKENGLISLRDHLTIQAMCCYGFIRPLIRKLYYALFRRMKTT